MKKNNKSLIQGVS